ncbi:TlyA family RNA methyltransferase [Leptotrichia shahii]|uniref:TlyA family RNA methyltransferase n=1 Tax=Leptotrichia shahii TaxID=157691 RepID=UPI0028D6C595|nr:TlyA family RNA methyltransferase [Leptotrichia shahii]
MKKRLDLILVERELFETREKAKREIMAGNVIVNEQVETKAGTMFMDNDKLKIRIKDKLKYVSRGGLKLEKAIKTWDLDFKDKLVLDIGASTGGFTDCALQNGAKCVYSVDVGKNQLDWKLRNDKRVLSLEEMHIKDLKQEDINNEKVNFIVIDVSFISLTKVIPYFKKFLAKTGKIVMLVKPQFEVGREKIGRNGVVENEEYHDEAIKKIISFSKEGGYELLGVEDSPIRGTKGNKEFLMLLKFS